MLGRVRWAICTNSIKDEVNCERRICVHPFCLEACGESYLWLFSINFEETRPKPRSQDLFVGLTLWLSIKITHQNNKIIAWLNLSIDPWYGSLNLMLSDFIIWNRMMKMCIEDVKSSSVN
jgi:hypothetical protein